MLVHKVKPAYPAAAKKAHIEGTVVLHAIIAKDGTVGSLEYVSGPVELKDSAIEAVKTWRYKPMLLNNHPVEVDTEISVSLANIRNNNPRGFVPTRGRLPKIGSKSAQTFERLFGKADSLRALRKECGCCGKDVLHGCRQE